MLVILVRMTLAGGYKARPQLRTRIPHGHGLREALRATDSPGTHQRLAQRADLVQELLR